MVVVEDGDEGSKVAPSLNHREEEGFGHPGLCRFRGIVMDV